MAASTTTVKLNYEGVGEMLRSSAVAAEMRRRAEGVFAAASATAPVVSGDYKASLVIMDATTDRAVAHVVAQVFYANIVEANTGTLARALDAAR